MTTQPLDRLIAGMPKIELHIHLEGAIPLDTLLKQIQRSGKEPSIKSVGDVRKRLVYNDFAHFIQAWTWKNTFIMSELDFEEMAFDVLRDLHRQNVVYAELTYSPSDYWRQNLSVEKITECVVSGMEKARRQFGIEGALILDLVRDYGPEKGQRTLDILTPFLGKGIVGLTIGGSEAPFPPGPFAAVYREAARRGFRLTAHAGEAAGPESVRACIEELGVERIGHGLRACEDPSVVGLLKHRRVPLEMCPTSNVRTQVCESMASHPFKRYYQQGLAVTVNSDDPTMFGATITDEFRLLADAFGMGAKDIRQISFNAIDAAFLPVATKTQLRVNFESAWVRLGGDNL